MIKPESNNEKTMEKCLEYSDLERKANYSNLKEENCIKRLSNTVYTRTRNEVSKLNRN